MNRLACPGIEQLSEFLVGSDSVVEIEKIEQHISQCSPCQQTLSRLDAKGDTLLNALKSQGTEGEFEAEPQLQQALVAARSFLSAGVASKPPSEKKKFDEQRKINRIREYQLLSKLGEGGMGTVYKARHVRLNRVVALKILHTKGTNDEQVVARFQKEMLAVGALDHENIVRASDAGEVRGIHYLVMELIDGEDLGKLSKRIGPLSIPDACELIRQAAIGLQHAHENGLVHRDIKPANLLLAHRGKSDAQSAILKILDLGLAQLRVENEATELTGDGQIMGTPDYMAPEQGRDSRSVDVRADIYSLGCTLYKLLTGRPPFTGRQYKTAISKVLAHAKDPVPPIFELRPEVSEQLAEVLERMMAKDPNDRYATPAEVAMALQPFTAMCDLSALLTGKPSRADAPSVSSVGTEGNLTAQLDDTSPEGLVVVSAAPRSMAARARRNTPPRFWIAAAVPLVLLLAVVLLLQKPNGTVRVEVNDPNLEISIDGRAISLTDKIWQGKKKASKHTLTLKLNGTTIPFNPKQGRFVLAGGKLSVKLGDTTLTSNRFEVARRGTTVLNVTYERQESVKSGEFNRFALQFDGTSSYVEIPDFKFDGSHPVTLEAVIDLEPKAEEYMTVFSNLVGPGLLLTVHRGRWLIRVAHGRGKWGRGGYGPKAKGRMHVAAVWGGPKEHRNEDFRVFVDGKPVLFRTHAGGSNPGWVILPMLFGASPTKEGKPEAFFRGKLHELRISKGARYGKAFEPQDHFQADNDTIVLYHVDEGTGTKLRDFSGENNHGQIIGAKWVKLDRATQAIDLLAGVDPLRDAIGGKWSKDESGSLRVVKDQQRAEVTLPGKVRGSYRIVSQVSWNTKRPVGGGSTRGGGFGGGRSAKNFSFKNDGLSVRKLIAVYQKWPVKLGKKTTFQFVYDEKDLESSGIDLDGVVTVDAQKIDVTKDGHDIIFRQTFGPVGLDFTRSGNDRETVKLTPKKDPPLSIGLTLPIGGSSTTLVISPQRPEQSGLTTADGKLLPADAKTVAALDVHDPKPHKIDAAVELVGDKAEITVTLDGLQLVHWQGTVDELKPISTHAGNSISPALLVDGWHDAEVSFKIAHIWRLDDGR